MTVIRPGTIVWFCVVVAVGYAMFQVKYEVMQQEQMLAGINKQITDDREQIRVLNAEWSYLTRPSRVEELSARFLHLGGVNSIQILPPSAVPERPDAGAPLAAASVPPATTAARHVAATASRSQP
jgi:cell division protein FtsL